MSSLTCCACCIPAPVVTQCNAETKLHSELTSQYAAHWRLDTHKEARTSTNYHSCVTLDTLVILRCTQCVCHVKIRFEAFLTCTEIESIGRKILSSFWFTDRWENSSFSEDLDCVSVAVWTVLILYETNLPNRPLVTAYRLQLMSGIVQRVPCTADIFCSILHHHLSYSHSWFIHQSSRVATETSSSKAGIWREISVYFIGRYLCHTPLRYSTCRKILRHGADGFTSPPKEVVLLICMTLKIHCLRLRLNPRTLGRMANTIATIPQRTTLTN
jgi:hypothetical protein